MNNSKVNLTKLYFGTLLTNCKRNKSGSLNGNALYSIQKKMVKQLEKYGMEQRVAFLFVTEFSREQITGYKGWIASY